MQQIYPTKLAKQYVSENLMLLKIPAPDKNQSWTLSKGKFLNIRQYATSSRLSTGHKFTLVARLGIACMLGCMAMLPGGAVAQPSSTCRQVHEGNPDSPDIQTYCRDDNGRWVKAAQKVENGLPENFRGNATYTGNYTLTKTAVAGNQKTQSYHGSVTIDLQIDGSTVHGSYTGSSPMNSGTVDGTRVGDTCHLTDRNSTWDVHCGRDHFDGQATSFERSSPKLVATFDASASKVTDPAENESAQAPRAQTRYAVRPQTQSGTRAQAQAVTRAQAQAAARAQAQAAALAALPTAGPAWTKKLEEIVETDSRGWAFNHFDRGSIHNVRIADGTAEAGDMTLRGDYTYNGGSAGWVLAKVTGGKLACIQFWDAAVGCRGLRTPEQGAAMRAVAAGAVKDALTAPDTSSSSDGNDGHSCQLEPVDTNGAGGTVYGKVCH